MRPSAISSLRSAIRAHSRACASSALNALVNAILYPAILFIFGIVVMGDAVFSQGTGGWILLGVLIGVGEATWRMREGILHGKPANEITYRAAIYGLAIAPLGASSPAAASFAAASAK